MLHLDFPARPATPIPVDKELVRSLGASPVEVLEARDLLALFASEEEVSKLRPDFSLMEQLDTFAVCVTAPGNECDFVSRFFAPKAGIPEDPVTGSAHCTLIPFWSQRLGKSELAARQISRRGGEIFCRHLGDRVAIGGYAVEYLRGEITF
jgi:predicted PhzF superfamily epimerase YddE/YHI9